MTVPYAKPWSSIPDQLRRLKSYGLIIADDVSSGDFLRHLNYYRFSGYGLAFEQSRHTFRNGTTFEEIRAAYCFDRALRDLITESLEIIELEFRAAIAYAFGQAYGPFGHTRARNLFHRFPHQDWLKKLHDETGRSDEIFVEHYKRTYNEYPDLPIWVATEIMSFGALSRMYRGMLRQDQKTVAVRYSIQPVTLQSWLHHLVYTRNLCAHHLRVWDRVWAISPDLPAGKLWQSPWLFGNNRLFASLLVQAKLLSHCSAEKVFAHDWRLRIEHLFDNRMPRVPDALARTGLPSNWKQHPLWIAL